jgi:mycoredoxin
MPPSSITIYGSSWCGDCFRVRRFLDKQKVPYDWIDIDKDREAEKFVIQTNHGMRSVPTIIFEDGTRLVEPSNETLARQLGIPNAR